MDEQIEDEISKDDNTPSILDQAKSNGWDAAYYNFGKAEGNRDWFNPSIIERDDGIWLLVRGSEPHPQGFRFGQNYIWAFEMDKEGKTPKRGIRLQWPVENAEQHFEDPRGFYHPAIDQTIISACTFIWYPDRSWTGAHQCIGSFDSEWQCSKMDYPKIGGSSGYLENLTDKKRYEKNWLPFLHDNRLHILYKAKPWQIVGYGQTWSDFQKYEGEGVSWAHGDVRGGTSPVKVGDLYFTFPHSSLLWRGRYRRYYAGAMAFDAKPPFTPRMITPEPILVGSQNDVWAQKKPLVIFPCGALYRNGKWLITAGVNDMKAAWIEIPHEDILKRMVEIGKSGESVFPAHGLSDAEVRKQKLRANLVKARAARVAKRNLSSVPVLAEPEAHDRLCEAVSRVGEARESTKTSDEMRCQASDSRGGTQKLSEERLAKLRANAAKARAAKAAKRMATHGVDGERQTGGFLDVPPHGTRSLPRRKRRKRRTKSQMAAARLKALQEYEAKKSLASLGQ